jgi:hypothetical protein
VPEGYVPLLTWTQHIERLKANDPDWTEGTFNAGHYVGQGSDPNIDRDFDMFAYWAGSGSNRAASELQSAAQAMARGQEIQGMTLTESGTLQVSEDSRGLRFDVKLPDVSYANNLVVLMERGDAYECSFAFNVPDGGVCGAGERRGQEHDDRELKTTTPTT